MPLVNHAVGLHDTPPHFRHVRHIGATKPLFYWIERKLVIFAVFVKPPLFARGQRHGLPKDPDL